MKPKRFSAQQLYSIRNQIPIEKVIKEFLQIPSKVTQGAFRFCCPSCKGFDSAILFRKNLARCFSCTKNFNPIDMVMAVRNTDFVESVNLLERFKSNLSAGDPQNTLKSDHVESPCLQMVHATPRSTGQRENAPVAIGDILSQFVKENQTVGVQTPIEANTLQPINALADLQKDVQSLADQVKQLKSIITTLQQK